MKTEKNNEPNQNRKYTIIELRLKLNKLSVASSDPLSSDKKSF